jgi:hypothetical protein
MENWSARRQGITGAPGSGGHNHAIGPVGGYRRAVGFRFYVNQANRHTVQHYIIQGMKGLVCNLGLEHGPFLNPAFPLEQTGQMRHNLVAIYLRDKPQPAQVYT